MRPAALARVFRTLRYLRPAQVVWRLWYRARLPVFRTRLFHRLFMTPQAGTRLPEHFPRSTWPGDPANGHRLLGGGVRLLELDYALGEDPQWHPADRSHLWRFTLNYFEWLADLAAVGTPAAARRARFLVSHWWNCHRSRFDGEAWHPYPLSLRLVAWLTHGDFLLEGADEGFRRLLADALDVQLRYLCRVVERDVAGNHIIKNLKALALGAATVPGHEHVLGPALATLKAEVTRQVLPDGGHYERSPSYHVQVLCDLVDLRDSLPDPPGWLTQAVERMAAAFAFFRHGDGRLAQFNDGAEGEGLLLDALAARVPEMPVPDSLPDSGYFRLSGEGWSAILDAGLCCPDDLPAHAHADMLSFELSEGPQRLIVNSGTYAYQDPVWRQRLRATAAHSTVVVDGVDSAEVYGVFRLGRRPRLVTARRHENAVEASHDGYARLGVIHRRRLDAEADGLVGTDWLECKGSHVLEAFFHLHPDVRAVLEGRNAVRLELLSGAVWRFETEDGTLALDAGYYSPTFYRLLPNRHIRVNCSHNRLCWRLSRLSSAHKDSDK